MKASCEYDIRTIDGIHRKWLVFATAILCVLLGGCPTSPEKTTIQRLEELAQAGSSAAQYNLGMAFNNGIGVEKNSQTAFDWFKKAARGGDPLAAYKVGCYLGGQFPGVVDIDEKGAFENKLVAANAGYSIAQHDVALQYRRLGRDKEAVHWWKLSADQGFHLALFSLSDLYQRGQLVEQDNALACFYFGLGIKMLFANHPPHLLKQIYPDEGFLEKVQMQALVLEQRLTEDEIRKQNEFIRTWEPRPTPLTLRAKKGFEEALELIRDSGR